MVASRSIGTVCHACRRSAFTQPRNCRPLQLSRLASRPRPGAFLPGSRARYSTRSQDGNGAQDGDAGAAFGSTAEDAQLLADAKARVVRAKYGEVLPEGLLTAEEYQIYEKLFGPPARILEDAEEDFVDGVEAQQPYDDLADEGGRDLAGEERHMLHGSSAEIELDEYEAVEEEEPEVSLREKFDDADRISERQRAEEEFEDMEERSSLDLRTHPYTLEGRFGTQPSTIFLPKETFIEPIASVLSRAPNRHLQEAAHKAFGGRNFPDSVATPSSKVQYLQQKPIALPATQTSMEPIESYAFVAANMAGSYATALSILTETRRRLGSSWLEGLLKRPGGPRILDAGSGGAAVLAWRDMLRAEWDRQHADGEPPADGPPLGKSTVVAASDELRARLSGILQDTTFLPRLPDFSRQRDLPGYPDSFDPGTRRHYDVIVAPHTLWHMKEDWQRKVHVQNLWSLLDPSGGVLVVSEKGVPRGFELVAGARALLLDMHIASPGSDSVETLTAEANAPRHIQKEAGCIVAPCTNHGACPMYLRPGEMAGRKDHCHFSQRFARPPFLQTLHGAAASRNHEDVRFAYVTVRRGADLRAADSEARQDEAATLAALAGHGDAAAAPPTWALPRVLLPPLKRHGHVTMDVCTPAATLERWTVPRSHGRQAYRDARKAQWGDLWALGAKTRVRREARAGRLPGEGRARVVEVVVGKDSGDDEYHEVLKGDGGKRGKGKGGKRTKKEKKGGGDRRRKLSDKEVEDLM